MYVIVNFSEVKRQHERATAATFSSFTFPKNASKWTKNKGNLHVSPALVKKKHTQACPGASWSYACLSTYKTYAGPWWYTNLQTKQKQDEILDSIFILGSTYNRLNPLGDFGSGVAS